MSPSQSPVIHEIMRAFDEKGHAPYALEEVSQLEHALQTAALAREEDASDSLLCAALLHDLGHILEETQMPENLAEDLHDRHEEKAYHYLEKYFGKPVAEPVKLHVAAKRYLCTTEAAYEQQLSPTSRKSYHDQGGRMQAEELHAFTQNPHYQDALRLRRWDDIAKVPGKSVPALETYLPVLQACLTDSTTT